MRWQGFLSLEISGGGKSKRKGGVETVPKPLQSEREQQSPPPFSSSSRHIISRK